MEPGAIVCRFASSWLRVGTFDLLRARGDRALIRQLATYLAEHVFSGWDFLKAEYERRDATAAFPAAGPTANRFVHLYRHIAVLNAITTAHWQAYGFTNGVLNTDNTSLAGLSLDFGPFAFLDNFDPSFTPNHDDHDLRYAYRNQPSIILWNLVRLGESLAELMGAGPRVDDAAFITAASSDWRNELVSDAEALIARTTHVYEHVFLAHYYKLMAARLGLKVPTSSDAHHALVELITSLLDTLHALGLDFHHFFRRLSTTALSALATDPARRATAATFFHTEGGATATISDADARARLASWLERWSAHVRADNDSDRNDDNDKNDNNVDEARSQAMRAVNPKFVPRAWVLAEVIARVTAGERDVLTRLVRMAETPFEESWGGVKEEEDRWCGDVPPAERGIMCSCSS